MNIYAWMENHSKTRASKTCLKTHDQEISYGELARWCRSLGTALKKAGVGKGDRVLVILPNIPEFVVSYMAVIGLGAVVVPVNPSYTPWELEYIVRDAEPKAAVLEKGRLETYREVLEKGGVSTVITVGPDGEFGRLLSEAPQEILEEVDPDHMAVLLYTSGLTGHPLGAMLTHRNLEHNSDAMRLCMDCDDSDTTLAVIPLFHTFSATVNLLSMLRWGGAVYLMRRLNFKEIDYAFRERGVTAMGAVPTLYFGLIHHPEVQGLDCSRMRTLISGGSALSLEVFEAFKKKFDQEIRQGYGVTEASPVCSVNRKHRPLKPTTIGQPIHEVEVQVVDEQGRVLKPFEKGELLFKGPNIMKGYYKHEKETAEVLKDGWLHTGDLGFVDEEGYITITGYKKPMIITSGFNVYIREVEGVLNDMAGVKDSAVVGVPDPMRGALVKAYVVPANGRITEQEIKHLAQQRLAPYKTPRQIVFVDSIPRDGAGKVRVSELP
jgi:long-chain acyl-CoA synthetase